MKMYLISDNVDTYTGMRLAGVDGVVVHERGELYEALQNGDAWIIYVLLENYSLLNVFLKIPMNIKQYT